MAPYTPIPHSHLWNVLIDITITLPTSIYSLVSSNRQQVQIVTQSHDQALNTTQTHNQMHM